MMQDDPVLKEWRSKTNPIAPAIKTPARCGSHRIARNAIEATEALLKRSALRR